MERNYKRNRLFLVVSAVLFSLLTINSFAQDMAVPANLQAALFKKIFMFNKTLQAKGAVEVVVLSGSGDGTEMVDAFKSAGLKAKSVSGNQVPAGAAVVYLMPGVTSTKQATAQKGVLSISGVTSYVENGDVAIGLGVEGGKPKILVNIAQLKAEGQEVSSDLLKIAKVIQ